LGIKAVRYCNQCYKILRYRFNGDLNCKFNYSCCLVYGCLCDWIVTGPDEYKTMGLVTDHLLDK